MRSPMPRSLNATEVKAASGTRHATATATMPTRRRIRAEGARRATPAFTAAPVSSRSTTISTTSPPNSPATLSFTDSGCRLFVNASLESAHAARAPAATSGSSRTGRLRSRIGTRTNHAIAPTAAAPAAPRDCVSRIARIDTPMAGYARTLVIALPVLRDPSQRVAGTAIAATQPTAFQ
jgi:hypothetical protein